MIDEKNNDLVIVGIEDLIEKRIIMHSPNFRQNFLLLYFQLKTFFFILIKIDKYNKDQQKDIPIAMYQDQLEEAYQLGIAISNREKEKV